MMLISCLLFFQVSSSAHRSSFILCKMGKLLILLDLFTACSLKPIHSL
jgi:hypothetical protein